MLGGLATIFLAAAFGLPSALLFQDESNVLGTILAAIGIYAVTFSGVFCRTGRGPPARRAGGGVGPRHLPRRAGDRARGTGPTATLKRSAGIFRERWGEQVTGPVSIGAVVMLATIPPAVILVAIGGAIGTAALVVCIVLAVILVIVGAVGPKRMRRGTI